MTKKIIAIENYSSTPYDDVYRTLVNDCPGLIIPVVNEVRKGVRQTRGGQILEYEAKDILDKGIAVGMEQGLEQGRERRREGNQVEQIQKKLAKDKPIPQIADELELSEERIQELIQKHKLKIN